MKNKQTKELFFIFQLKTVVGSLNITLTITVSDWEGGYLLQHCMEKQRKKLRNIFSFSGSLKL